MSNASDALSKARYEVFQKGETNAEFVIKVVPIKEKRQIVVSDTGIGMSKDELINNLGTIAKSGTRAFMNAMKETSPSDASKLIGSFGVGFYSSFLVADSVEVYTRRLGEGKLHKWSSQAQGSFEVAEVSDEEAKELPETFVTRPDGAPHGTDIVLNVKVDHDDYLDFNKLRTIIKTHNQFLENRVEMYVEKTVSEEVPDDSLPPVAEESENKDESEEPKTETETETEGKVEEIKENDEKPKMKTITKTVNEWEEVTLDKPIWFKEPADISDKEYMDAYRAISNELHKYSAVKHISGEGTVNYKGILFIPARPQNDLYDSKKEKSTVKVFSRNVFITDRCKDLIPEWLEFIYGAVDSEDIPLNVSRELLQGNKALKIIGKTIVKKSIELLTETMNDEEKWKEFYEKFSKSIKFGVNTDFNNKKKLMELLRYESSKTDAASKEMISLAKYVERMHKKQKVIYYICGEDRASLEKSPYMELPNKYGYEVLFMTEALDEYLMQNGQEYEGKQMVSIAKVDVEIPDPEADDEDEDDKEAKKKKQEALDADFKIVVDAFTRALGNKVSRVTLDHNARFVKAPLTMCNPAYGMTANMERIIRAQALRGGPSPHMGSSKVIVLNTEHETIKKIKDELSNVTPEKDASGNDIPVTVCDEKIHLLYNIGCLSAGYSVDDINDFAQILYDRV